jgi:tRNA threonylcarbamoyladenosine biosynthesis protein TsaE
MERFTTPQETQEWGRQLARTLEAGAVLALCGDLGAGKTCLTQGIVAGLGSQAEVTSPTFSLVQEYRDGRLPVFHLDFYRLESEGEVLRLGWDELLDENGVVLVEWADRFPALMPVGTRWFFLCHEEAGGRSVREAAPPQGEEAAGG